MKHLLLDSENKSDSLYLLVNLQNFNVSNFLFGEIREKGKNKQLCNEWFCVYKS